MASRTRSAQSALLDRFDDVRLLHAGSRFMIYAAAEARTGHRVAIKVVNEQSDYAGCWLDDALDHEARVLGTLSGHPHVVTLYQRLTRDNGRAALVLEYADRSLDDDLRAGRQVTHAEATAIGIKIAGALETVHRAGVVHGDVRPDNILRSVAGEPLLTGFHDSVRLGAGLDRGPRHITTAHTAPELLEGGQPMPASDVYGLASTLYELLAGSAAFRAYAGESPATVMMRVLTSPVRPIVAPGLPLELSDLLTWCLSADAANRPPSPAWLAEELGRIARRQGWPHTRMVVD